MNKNFVKSIFDKYQIQNHDFDTAPFIISTEMIKQAAEYFTKANEREV